MDIEYIDKGEYINEVIDKNSDEKIYITLITKNDKTIIITKTNGGYEIFLCGKSMLMFAQEDPVYAGAFFDHLVEEGELDGEIGDMNKTERINPFEYVE